VNINWELVLGILGTVAGLLACIRLFTKDIINIRERPALKISQVPDGRNWTFPNTGETRRFITLEVSNQKARTAHRCVAVAEVIEQPRGVTHLQRTYGLHWADVPYSGLSTGAEPVDIGMEPRRLDVVFTTPGHKDVSWIALPLALSLPGNVPQAALPKGEYILKIKVSCENGKGDSKLLRVFSPSDWRDLAAEQV
jgi:hypothetical protein